MTGNLKTHIGLYIHTQSQPNLRLQTYASAIKIYGLVCYTIFPFGKLCETLLQQINPQNL